MYPKESVMFSSIVNPMSEDQSQSYVEGSLLPDLMSCRSQGSNQKPLVTERITARPYKQFYDQSNDQMIKLYRYKNSLTDYCLS